MKISILIPVYNVEKYIRECVDSILNQTFHDFELLLVDDGSKDSSGAILDEYAKRDERIQVFHQKNAGVSAARNAALTKCRGQYIYIMDSDDYLEPNALQLMADEADRTGADVIISDHYTFIQSDSQIPSHFFLNDFVTCDKDIILQIQNMVLYLNYSPFPTNENCGLGIAAPWTKLVRRDLIFNNHLEFDSYVKGVFDDGLFALHVFEYAEKVSYIRQCVYHYRVLQTSLIHRYRSEQLAVYERIFERIQAFSETNKKGKTFEKAFSARIVFYFFQSFRCFFFHADYQGTVRDNYVKFMKTINSRRYSEAMKSVEISRLTKPLQRVVLLYRWHMQPIIWVVYYLKRKQWRFIQHQKR